MKRWYVLQVYAGYEEAVKADLLRTINEKGLNDWFGDILIPAAKTKQMFDLDVQKDQQLFPGYMLIEVEMRPEVIKLVKSNLRVLRFLGGTEPVPLAQREINRILSQITGEITVASEVQDFNVGAEVEIKEGPFAGFIGIIEKVDKESERVTIMVSIFGRMTPVELGFQQIKR
jgi:transcriptional antiterminator NusG